MTQITEFFSPVFVGSDTVSTTYLLCDLEQVPKPL